MKKSKSEEYIQENLQARLIPGITNQDNDYFGGLG